jgi:hypothetical protein
MRQMEINWAKQPVLVGCWIIMLTVTGLYMAGCVLKHEGEVLVQETKQREEETERPRPKGVQEEPRGSRAWQEGNGAFEKGEYMKAAVVFENLRQETQSEELRHKALYALACTRLMMAQSPESFREALDLWDRWRKTAPTPTSNEDPRMLTPLLQRMPQPLENQQVEMQRLRNKVETLEEIHRNLDFALWEYWGHTSPSDVLREDPLKVRPRLQDLPQLLQRQQDEIQRLRNQIEALEEIDRTIEEKKKEATSD